jgi:hypothetical protein
MQNKLVRNIRRLGPAVVVLSLALSISTQSYAQSADPTLQGRVFQSSDGALWVYKDGVKYPVIGVDLSDEAIDAIPAVVDQPIERLDQLFAPQAATSAPAAAPSAPPPPAPPILDVANPHPNDRIPAGLDMRGVAYDPLAAQGSGIDRVQLFLEDREKGGTHLGDANLGTSITNGWEIVVSVPPGPHNLFVYARSSETGLESVVSIPVEVAN